MSLELTVRVSDDGIATLDWSGTLNSESLERAVRTAADEMLLDQQLRRVEVSAPADDPVARRALLRAGFRLEGVRRQVLERSDGSYAVTHRCLVPKVARR